MLLRVLLFSLPIATVAGWYFGFKHHRDFLFKSKKDNSINQDYFLGLNYLINEQPDKAVDAFIKVLEVNNDTVEMHLALGSLFRRQGKVERAIRIHQNLIARPQLNKEERIQALCELGQDYLCAGVLDRAERLFLELLEINSADLTNYQYLLNIYEKQKDWRQAINIARKFVSASKSQSWTPLAYYYCELVDETLKQGLIDEAQIYLKKALVYDKNCVRASILAGNLEYNIGKYKNALCYYQQVKEQDKDFVSEVAPFLSDCYEKLNREEEGLKYLQECFVKYPTASLALFLASRINKRSGVLAAIKFITEEGEHSLSLRVLDYLLELYLNVEENIGAECNHNFLCLRRFLSKLLETRPSYRCTNCGFGVRCLYWQCPSCKRWGAVKPIKKFEVDMREKW